MVEFEKTIVHILDCEHDTCLLSSSCMEIKDEEVTKMLQTKAEKVFRSLGKKKGVLKKETEMGAMLSQYAKGAVDFIQASKMLAQHIFDKKMKYALYASSDLLIAQVMNDGRRYLLAIDNSYIEGITHTLKQQNGEIVNEIISYKTLLNGNLVKNDRAFLLELSDLSLYCIENKVEIEGEKVNFFADVILKSETIPSYKESIKEIKKVTEAMREKYDLDEVVVMPKIKSIIKENIENQTPIQVEEVAQMLFADRPLIQDDFKAAVKKQGIPEHIEVENVKPTRNDKMQRIKTDNGIEIQIPVDYMNATDFVEFKTQSDGTITIQLKNINHIISK